MFTAEHFIWIGLCAGAVAGLCALSVQKKLSLKTAGGIITAICVLSEVSKGWKVRRAGCTWTRTACRCICAA